MTVNVNEARGLEVFGVAFKDDDGNAKLYLTSGVGSPVGLSAPINSWYFQEDDAKLWRNQDGTGTGWVEFVAEVAASIEIGNFADNALESTTSNDWVTKLNITTASVLAGEYIIIHSSQVTNSANNRETGYRVQWKPSSSGTWIDLYSEIVEFPKGESFTLFTGVDRVVLASSGTIDIRTQYGQTDGGGTGRIKSSSATIFKVVT